ncbi:MerR family transcriptional regulator [Plantactinospora sp. GCM10030261]|uniref:DNA polymerase III subunit beta family protein n=1 Tax=Plantactinospora sp. GCM10030261 TaxID=3273420 RepID=UPI00361CD0DD
MRSIGEMARASGLSVSALRFYDGAGLLVPAAVDPHTGYRWYAPEQLGPARLLAHLRRVGMPLAEIGLVLASWGDPTGARPLLDAHLRRLEDGLSDARQELSRAHALLDRKEPPMLSRHIVCAADLAGAISSVRFAVGTDPAIPVLSGVLIELDPTGLRLVATDRYRLAVARADVRDAAGPAVRATAPADLVDEAYAMLVAAGPADAVVEVDGADLVITADGRRTAGAAVPGDFPDVDRLLRDRAGAGPRRVSVDAAALRGHLADRAAPTVVREHDGVPREIVVLTVDPAGAVRLAGTEAVTGTDPYVGLDREFLLDALDAGAGGQLVLELDGPIRPLAVRSPDDDRRFSVLMPVRLT